ncbi:hypothetical protein A0H81_13584 [Grifola frondosa]|uniref:DUF6534 domain-containing protein n=1 Tax=Grifola frondosa TaxID=5627 RepID=A0A1C7LNM1_GRIFR|nr:hypothetical protein A0H81_13584 [Grifola frondosa]
MFSQVQPLHNTFGALLIGSYLATMLYGLTTHQTYRYFRLYATDGWSLKSMVICLWLLDSFHTIIVMHTCYYYLVTSYAKPENLLIGVWSTKLVVAITSIVTVVSHLFLTRRVYLLGNRSIVLATIIIILALARLGFGLATSIEAFVQSTFTGFAKYTWLICSSFGSAVLSDALITIALCVFLHRSRTGHKRSDSVIDVLMVYTINTGLFTGNLFTLVALICAATMPHNLIYFAVYIIVSKMYTNSLLAVLNSRRSILDRGAEGFETGSFGLENRVHRRNSCHWEGVNTPGKPPCRIPAIIDVVVTTETFQQVDPSSEHQGKLHDDQSSSLNETFDM